MAESERDWRKVDAIELKRRVRQGEPDAKAEQRRRLSCLKGAVIPSWELQLRPNLLAEINAAVRACQ